MVNYREFLLGLVSMDPETPHESVAMVKRLKYIFKVLLILLQPLTDCHTTPEE